MKKINLLSKDSSLLEVKKAFSELTAPAPLRIAKMLNIKDLKTNKLLNIHEIFENAELSDIINAYNELMLVRAGNIKIFKEAFEYLPLLIPIIEQLVDIVKDGKIEINEIKDFIEFKKNK